MSCGVPAPRRGRLGIKERKLNKHNLRLIKSTFSNKTVLITGNTGFKGSWLTVWLLQMGANVIGLSKSLVSKPSMFEDMNLEQSIRMYWGEVQDARLVSEIIRNEKPDFVFHMAAQAIVSESFENPTETFSTNVIGTTVVLNELRDVSHNVSAIIVTSDKCYENQEWVWGYKETDPLGGKDPYSASKAAAEQAYKSFYHSFFKNHQYCKIASARAGNVVGGGDWAKTRVIPDLYRSWFSGKAVELRRPNSTRPWQHVLEPLSGYLLLAAKLNRDERLSGESFNFGPNLTQDKTVLELVHSLSKVTQSKYAGISTVCETFGHEAGLLKLNCEKASQQLEWGPTLDWEGLTKMIDAWYVAVNSGEPPITVTQQQIAKFEQKILD